MRFFLIDRIVFRLFDLTLRVIAGEVTAAEALSQHQFMMLRQGPVY